MWDDRLSAATPSSRSITPEHVEWLANGSLLLARYEKDAESLRERCEMLQNNGISATYLNASQTQKIEPALRSMPATGGSLLVPQDSQLNGMATLERLLEACFSQGHRFQAAFNESCENIVLDARGHVSEIRTSKNTPRACGHVVLAAGAWSGRLLAQALDESSWQTSLEPRRGHLIELSRPRWMPPLRHGLMEVGYTRHYLTANNAAAQVPTSSETNDVTFTATSTAQGSILVGSSREFQGWDSEPSPRIVDSIMQHACEFLPDLAQPSREACDVRVGLRPFSRTGPMIGPVPGCHGLILAAGHEGSGLTMAPATAELVADYVLGREFGLSESSVEWLLPRTVSTVY